MQIIVIIYNAYELSVFKTTLSLTLIYTYNRVYKNLEQLSGNRVSSVTE